MELRDLTVIFLVLVVLFGVGAFLAAGALGWGLGVSLVVPLVLAAIVAALILTWPMAWVLTVIFHLLRPEQRAPSGSYSIDQGKESGDDKRGRS